VSAGVVPMSLAFYQFTSKLVIVPAPADEFWNNVAEKYAKKPVTNVSAFEAKKAAIKARLRRDDVVLDIGCGTGSVAIELAACAGHVHAFDLSAEMIRIGERKAAAAGVTNITFHVGAVADLSRFEPETFDMICAMNLLHLVEDRAGAFAAFFNLLKPGGFFVESTVVLGESWVPYRFVLAVMKLVNKAPPVWVFRANDFYQELSEAGFRNVDKPNIPAGKLVAFSVSQKPAPHVEAPAQLG
jgi:ubiquinone/menaquinone biosynthesis C-methylase UbiE